MEAPVSGSYSPNPSVSIDRPHQRTVRTRIGRNCHSHPANGWRLLWPQALPHRRGGARDPGGSTGAACKARTSRATKRATLVVPSWTRRVASHYAVPRRRASRGALRVGTRSPRTEVCRGGTGFSSTCSLADRTSAPTFYAVSPVTSSARMGAPVQRLNRVTSAPCATDNSGLGQAKSRPYGRVGGLVAAIGNKTVGL